MEKKEFRADFCKDIFNHKYALTHGENWRQRAIYIVDDVCGTMGGKLHPILSKEERQELVERITTFKFLPGGRYIYYAGRPAHFWNNCYLFRAEEDTREEWAELSKRCITALMTGGGIGVDYSILRPRGRTLSRTGGKSSGPIPLMHIIDNAGHNVMQGGSRRSAIYASLNWRHEDAEEFLTSKDWHNISILNGTSVWDVRNENINFKAPLDHTNISLNYDNYFLGELQLGSKVGQNKYEYDVLPEIFLKNVEQALRTGEPGFSFNFGDRENETLRNACTEVTSEDDSDVCNLGSVNIANHENLEDFKETIRLASKFLVCGTVRAELPFEKVYEVREKNRRLGLGLMGLHEWLLKRGSNYEVTPELREWLEVYERESENSSNEHCDRLYLSRPVAYRAIAPTGTIGILAGTTTGIEPIYAVAYKRRYLVDGTKWKYQFVVDSTAELLIQELGINPEEIETSVTLADEPERRIKFQAEVQKYVDMAISSTINLPPFEKQKFTPEEFARLLARFSSSLRGFTCYPDGARGGQPITAIPYADALKHKGVIYEETDICDISGKGGTCGS